MRRAEATAAVRVGTFDVSILVDGAGSFATIAEAFPVLDAAVSWANLAEEGETAVE